MTPEQIAELEALAAKATPGPWLRSNDPKKWVSTLAPITSQEWRDNVENDAALIIALRNNLPAILAALKAQQPDEAMVARALAPHMEGGREFDQMPPDRIALRKWSREGMCNTNDATQDDALEAARAALEASGLVDQSERIKALEDRLDSVNNVLSGLSSYVGSGLGDDATTPEQWGIRIRKGIEGIGGGYRYRAAQIVEECSKRPSTTWGEVKRAILDDTVMPTPVLAELEANLATAREAIEHELAMSALANVESSTEWIDGFEFAWKRTRAALDAIKEKK